MKLLKYISDKAKNLSYFFERFFDKFKFWVSLWFNTYPFLLSIENPPKYPLFNTEDMIVTLPKIYLFNTLMEKKFRLFLKPHAIKYWIIFYFISFAIFLFPLYINTPINMSGIYKILGLVGLIGLFYFLSYSIIFSWFYKVSVLNEAWNDEAKILGEWFKEVPQIIKIKIDDVKTAIDAEKIKTSAIEKEIGELTSEINKEINKEINRLYHEKITELYELNNNIKELKSLKSWIIGKKHSPLSNIRNPLYSTPQGLSTQKSIMLAAMLDYYGKINNGIFLKKFNIYFIWFMPVIISFFSITFYICYDLIFWECQYSRFPSKYAILPSISWFIITAMYLKWAFYHISLRSDNELRRGQSNYINIQSMLRGYLHIDGSFYRKFDVEGFQKSIIAAFISVFSIQIVIIIAIHNICSIYLN